MLQTGLQSPGETGKLKNCTSWAEYEMPNASSTAVLCNGGGRYNGNWYNRCPSADDCRAATYRRDDTKTHLPLHRERPFGGSGSSVVASTPGLMQRPDLFDRWGSRLPATIPAARTTTALDPRGSPYPGPIIPPQDYPAGMRTPYVTPSRTGGGITPTFLPGEEEGIFERLAKNIGQGLIGATGWHIFEMAQSVDFFPAKRKT